MLMFLLYIVSALAIQHKQVRHAFVSAWNGRSGLYSARIMNKTYFWLQKPTCYKDVVDPDFILYPGGLIVFFDRTHLFASAFLSFLPVIPGIAYLCLFVQILRFKNNDKYILKATDLDDIRRAA